MASRRGDPELGPLAPFAQLTTSSVPVRDRLDFWRSFFVSCEITQPTASRGDPFRGELLLCEPGEGAAFAQLAGDPLVCKFGRRESDLVLLGRVRAGRLNVRHDGDERTILDQRNGLVLLDCDRPLETTSTAYDIAHLMLPRPLVVAALGGEDRLRDNPMVELPSRGLAPVLLAQMDTMARHGPSFNRMESAVAMRTATSLAVTLLSQLGGGGEVVDGREDHRLVAARQYIEAHAGRAGLTPVKIASAVGCSRAHLYRLFADRSLTVAGVLRDVRLARARLEIETNLRPIGEIAFDVGYSDLSAFGKAFKRRYGLTPGDCRRWSQERGTAPH